MVDIAVVAPSALLTVTIERGADGADELHLHPGGQGFWVARVLQQLGAEAALCCPIGGETGAVVRALLPAWGVVDRTVDTTVTTASYVHDRRGGQREVVAEVTVPSLDRHAIDDFYSEALAVAVEAGVCVVTGRTHPDVVPDEVYQRLGADLAQTGVRVVGDLHGRELAAFLDGGPIAVLKVSDEDLRGDGDADETPTDEARWRAIARLHEAGAEAVVLSRARDATLALVSDRRFVVHGPELDVVEHRGAGDTMTAGLATALARGLDPEAMLRLATAAAGANVVRHGLGTASTTLIESLVDQVEVAEQVGTEHS